MNKKNKFSYVWNWLKIAFICILFFSLMFLQLFQAKKIGDIKSKIIETNSEIVNISLKLSEIDIELEKIRNSDIIDNIAINQLGMVKAKGNNYNIIESKKNEKEDSSL
jgi:hypothetical protein